MPKLIKDAVVVENQWAAPELTAEDNLPEGNVLVSLEYWNANQESIQARPNSVGLKLESTDLPEDIQGDLQSIPVIAVNFPAFADGRGFSIGRLLRERHQ